VREQFDVGARLNTLSLQRASCNLQLCAGFFGYVSCFMASQRLLERARGGGRVLVVSSMASIMCVPLACMVLVSHLQLRGHCCFQ
jgi:hypothetical protein